jgi:hypothetical protein
MPFRNQTGASRASITYIAKAVKYYLLLGILLPIAYLFNKSYLLQHPGNVLPTFIAPKRNRDVRIFSVPPSEITRIAAEHDQHVLDEREWYAPHDVLEVTVGERTFRQALTLEQPSQFPDGRLTQGMGIVQRGHFLFIWEEVGRWPTRHDQVATRSYSWDFKRFFLLFIPVSSLVDAVDNREPWVELSWKNSTTLHKLVEWIRQNKECYSQA